MKVVHLYSGNYFGGVERVLLLLFQNQEFMPNLQQEFILIFEGILARRLREKNAIVYVGAPVKLLNLFTVLRAWFFIFSVLKKSKAELLVCHDVWSFILGHIPGRIFGIKLVLWVHTDGLEHPLFQYLSFFRPDLLISCSNFLKEKLVKKFKKIQVETIYAPYDFSDFDFGNKIESDKFEILFVGRMNSIKGLDILIQALSNMNSHSIHLNILGTVTGKAEEEYLSTIKNLISRLDLEKIVNIHINSTDVHEFYRVADVYCQPNRHPETFGLTFIEALASGITVITTALGGAIEILKTEQKLYGTFVGIGDASAVASALGDWMINADRRKEIALSASNRARELCSAKNIMPQIENLLQRQARNR